MRNIFSLAFHYSVLIMIVWFCGSIFAQPILTCRIYAPDSLGLNATKTGVEPNPFYIRYVLKNIGNASIGMQQAQVSIMSGPDISVIPPPPAIVVLNKPLVPGDSLDITWRILVMNRRTFRLPRFSILVTDFNGDWLDACDVELPIRNLDVSLSCFASGPDTIHYDSVRKTFSPDPFRGWFDLFNSGGDTLTNVTATITSMPPQVQLAVSDSEMVKVIPVLSPAVTGKIVWQFTLSPTGRLLKSGQSERIGVSYMADGIPLIDNDCYFDLWIEPNTSPTIVRPGISPSIFYLGQNYPNPFTRITIIQFDLTPSLSSQERVITAGDRVRSFKVYDIFGREVLDLSEHVRNNSTLKIQNSQLPSPGIYFYRLTIGNESQTRMMVLIR